MQSAAIPAKWGFYVRQPGASTAVTRESAGSGGVFFICPERRGMGVRRAPCRSGPAGDHAPDAEAYPLPVKAPDLFGNTRVIQLRRHESPARRNDPVPGKERLLRERRHYTGGMPGRT